MNEQLEKAFQTANYMATLTNQRNVAFEEFQQALIYYVNGSSFQITIELISFVKSIIDAGNSTCVIVDDNKIPVNVENLQNFHQAITDQYFEASNEYYSKYSEIKSKRKIEDLIAL
jgi:hypothetical protein